MSLSDQPDARARVANVPHQTPESRQREAEGYLRAPSATLEIVERLGASAPRYLSALLENLGAGALLIEGDERTLVLANRALGDLVGLSVSQVLQMSRAAFVEHVALLAEDPDEVRETLGSIPHGAPYAAESRLSLVRPRRRVIHWEARPVALPQGVGQLCIYRDVTLEVEAAEALQRLANTDPLTGLANRRQGVDALQRELARVDRHQGSLCVALFDIDHFKRINDTLGHAAGDDVLRLVGQTLSESSRRVDWAIRWGGEEFLVLLPDCTLEGARVLAERFRAAVERLPGPGGGRALTVSGGIAQYRSPEPSEQLLRRADELMYRAKSAGRNRVELAESECEPQVSATAV